MQLFDSNDYENILLNSSGLLDVRAPIEFKQGAFPRAENLPLLNDEERHQVGICYKNKGQKRAIEFGHQLVQGDLRQQRINQWVRYAKRNENAFLYCFRGGLRSKITQQWLYESGIDMPRVHGGYKALRNYLIKQLDTCHEAFNFVLLGGLTGCRKTHLIKQLKHGIDLEGAAHHRGSSFGAHATPQSSQINFENRIALDFLNATKQQHKTVALEDESRFIGSVDIPKNIFEKMRSSPLIVVDNDLESRLQQLLKEYIVDMEDEFYSVYTNNDEAFHQFSLYLSHSLKRISKRLGLDRWEKLEQNLQISLSKHKTHGDIQGHLSWLKPLLEDYYDPMYSSQLAKRASNIIFRGNYDECCEFLNQYEHTNTQSHV